MSSEQHYSTHEQMQVLHTKTYHNVMYGIYHGSNVLALKTGVIVASGFHGDC